MTAPPPYLVYVLRYFYTSSMLHTPEHKNKKKTNKKDGRFAKRKGKVGQGKSKGIKGQEQGEAPLFSWAGQEQGGMPLLYPINYIPVQPTSTP